MPDVPKMTVEIWSDVICPFCYIGKRKFERALAQLPQRDRIEVVWKSFQLQPDTKTDPSRNAVQHAAERKGWTLDFARQAMAEVTERAMQVGLPFHYDRTVVANTFDAHRLAHYAAAEGKGDEMAEQLFRAYFTDGRNIADPATLAALASHIGLPDDGVKRVLDSDQFAADVRRDIHEAERFGIHAVPCFVFDRKYAVSGAQEPAIILQALQQSLAESTGNAGSSTAPSSEPSDVCDLAGSCD
jgi:predicted DsbA family dithiol-disulfide isomerase